MGNRWLGIRLSYRLPVMDGHGYCHGIACRRQFHFVTVFVITCTFFAFVAGAAAGMVLACLALGGILSVRETMDSAD
jgi:hypothetical protein